MTDARNVEGRISDWLEAEEAGTHYPDRLLSAAFDETRGLRQVRSRRWAYPAARMPRALAAAAVGAAMLVVVAGIYLGSRPPSPDLPTVLRQDGEILVFTGGPDPGWDLAAQDPETAKVTKIVDTSGIIDCEATSRCTNFVKTARWSPDGRWVAF